MKGKPDLRVPSNCGRENYGEIRKACGCNLGTRCEHVYKRCMRSVFNPITLTWKCDCKQKGWKCDVY